ISAGPDPNATARGHDLGVATILGANIEGPYISRERCGAQPAAMCRAPVAEEFTAWLDRDGLVTQMTLAPELPGAMELIEALLEREVLPSGGHTAASYQQVRAAIDAGLCQATHLFNCMSTAAKSGPFRQPGALDTFFADDIVMMELIAEGKPGHPELRKIAG